MLAKCFMAPGQRKCKHFIPAHILIMLLFIYWFCDIDFDTYTKVEGVTKNCKKFLRQYHQCTMSIKQYPHFTNPPFLYNFIHVIDHIPYIYRRSKKTTFSTIISGTKGNFFQDSLQTNQFHLPTANSPHPKPTPAASQPNIMAS